jgi:hypothetical protein
MDQTFQHSLEELYKDDPEQRATLNQIVNRFMNAPFNWPVPNVGDTLRSYTEAYFFVVYMHFYTIEV